VKTEFVGKKKFVGQLEIWQNGKTKPRDFGWIGGVSAQEVSYSVREIKDQDGKSKYQFTFAVGGSTVRRMVDVPSVKLNVGTVCANLSKEIRSKDGEFVPVWIMTAGDGTQSVRDESFEDRAKRVEWAMVFKVKFEKAETD
jgi:hypothetical protein